MASVTLTRRASTRSRMKKSTRTFSFEQSEVQSPKIRNNRFQHLCSRLKRRLTLTKEHRTSSDEITGNISKHRLGNYKSFSSTFDESSNDIEWPDFEKVYDSLPSCLINALSDLNDCSIDKKSDDSNFQMDQSSIETMNLFLQCKRGKNFRRNAICLKLDKTQYNGQLDIFIQQLMVEKLMRAWT